VPNVSAGLRAEILDTCIAPVVDELTPYQGVLFAGLMLTADGPKVLEYNCRFGDPEAQVLLARMPTQVGTLLYACATGALAAQADPAHIDHGAAVTVVVASAGYPGAPRTGMSIDGVDEATLVPGVMVFHAGTAIDAEGRLVTAGGRVLAVTGTGPTIREARDRAYLGVEQIRFEGMQFRADIAARAAEEER